MQRSLLLAVIGFGLAVPRSVAIAMERRRLDAADGINSPIVSIGKDGRLAYETDEHGNRIPDFSHCGHKGGDEAIPDVPVRVVVSPVQGDNTKRSLARTLMSRFEVRGSVFAVQG